MRLATGNGDSEQQRRELRSGERRAIVCVCARLVRERPHTRPLAYARVQAFARRRLSRQNIYERTLGAVRIIGITTGDDDGNNEGARFRVSQ